MSVEVSIKNCHNLGKARGKEGREEGVRATKSENLSQ